MILEAACEEARRRRDLFDMDIHVLRDSVGEYFTILDINRPTYINSKMTIDKTLYYTAWKLKK